MTTDGRFVRPAVRRCVTASAILAGALVYGAVTSAQEGASPTIAAQVPPAPVPVEVQSPDDAAGEAGPDTAQTDRAASPDQPTPTSDVPPVAPGPTSPLARLFGPTRVYSTADTYYEYNGNEPASGNNVLRNFDEKDNQFSLSYFELAFEQVPTVTRRFGFRADLGFGPTATWIDATDPNDGALKYLQQGYASVLAPVGRGLQIDAGKFVTPIGAEPIETSGNWNYSRSLLFAWAAPYYHVGVRAALPLTETVTVTGFVVNGWNNAQDNNRGKTLAAQVSYKPTASLTLSQAWMGGPEGPNGTDSYRNLFDSIATWTVHPRLSLMTNVDIGRDEVDGQTAAWQGVAVYGRVSVRPTWAITPRFEVFEDRDGFATGTAQTLREVTLTSDHTLFRGLSLRLEYRRDWSTAEFFEYRDDQFRPRQNTFLVGFTYAMSTP